VLEELIIRSKALLGLGLAEGGSNVSPYSGKRPKTDLVIC